MTTRLTWSVLIGVAGLVVSAYLTATHYLAGAIPLACGTGGVINCEQPSVSTFGEADRDLKTPGRRA